MALTKVPNELSSTPSIVDGGNATAMTITSDEDLLVTKGSLDVATVGHELRASGYSAATRDGATVGSYTRLNSDGTILEFRKDSAAVGSIGTANSGDLYIGNDDTSLLFAGGSDAILPRGTAGATRDAAIDLGLSAHRFRDAHISRYVIAHQGAFLGGNSSSNYLNSYEVGSFTPLISTTTGSITLNTSEDTCSYTKIGRLVLVHGRILIGSVSSPTGQIYIRNFPFAILSSVENSVTGAPATVNLYNLASNFVGQPNAEFTSSYSGSILIRENGATTSSMGGTAARFTSGSRIGFNLCYLTGQ